MTLPLTDTDWMLIHRYNNLVVEIHVVRGPVSTGVRKEKSQGVMAGCDTETTKIIFCELVKLIIFDSILDAESLVTLLGDTIERF